MLSPRHLLLVFVVFIATISYQANASSSTSSPLLTSYLSLSDIPHRSTLQLNRQLEHGRCPHYYSTTLKVASKGTVGPILFKLRGGDLGPISGQTLASIVTCLFAADGCAAIIASIANKEGTECSKMNTQLRYGIGASATSIAAALFAALLGPVATTSQQVLGYGFLTRLIFITGMILTKKYRQLEFKAIKVGILWLIHAVTVCALLLISNDYQHKMTLAKAVSLLLVLGGGCNYLKPSLGADSSLAQTESSTSYREIALFRSTGAYLMLNGAVLGMLAQGMDAVKVTGYITLISFPMLWSLASMLRTHPLFSILISVPLSAMTAGMLL